MAEETDKQEVTRDLALTELGDSGLKRSGGFILEELLRQLQGKRGIRIYQEMSENDDIIGASLFVIEELIRQVEWTTVAGGTQPDDERNRVFLQECMEDMSHSFDDLISEVLTMNPYGWAYHELVYKLRNGDQPETEGAPPSSKFNDGLMGWRKIPLRAQDSLWNWQIDGHGGIQGMIQLPIYSDTIRAGQVFIPIQKALLFRTSKKKNNPEGRSLLRNAYRPWYFKKRIQSIEAIGIERDLAGMPFAEVPSEMLSSTATAAQKETLAAIKNIVTNIRRDEQEGLVWPLEYDDNGNKLYIFSLLGPSRIKAFNTNNIINRYDTRIALTMLADFLLIGHEGVGSFALVESRTELFATAIGATLDIIMEVLNRFAVPRLFKLNPTLRGELPMFQHGDIETPDLDKLGKFLTAMSTAGFDLSTNEEAENVLLDAAGLPRPPRDEAS